MRTRYLALLAAILAVTLALIPLTAGGQSDGRDAGAQPGTPAGEAPAEAGEAFTGWDGDGPMPRTLVHSGDSTIQGGLCVGFDCSSNEPMGFATIKVEENNLRIAAADSSTVSGFPTRDWQLEFNSSSSGGGSYFMVRDCGNGGAAGSVDSTCGGTPMLTIEGGADNESIHVDSSGNQGGNVGFGTATPVVDLHALSGNTPTLRLEQDNSSGFTPQSWDMAGNESNFFIRDVTNGSALPFRIEPGTASNTLYLDNQEFIGIGTTSPQSDLHLRRSGNPSIRLENASAGRHWELETFASGTQVGFHFDDTGATPFTVDGPTRRLAVNITTPTETLHVGGNILATGSITPNSDYYNKRLFNAVDPSLILEKVAQLDITSWSYLEDPVSVRHIGPTAQQFNAAFGVGGAVNGISTVDADGVALTAIQALYAQNVELRAANDALLSQLEALEARVTALGG